MQYTHTLITKQNQPVSPSPAIQRKAIFTLSHSLQTSVGRGSEKDLAMTCVATSCKSITGFCYFLLLNSLAISKECLLHTCHD